MSECERALHSYISCSDNTSLFYLFLLDILVDFKEKLQKYHSYDNLNCVFDNIVNRSVPRLVADLQGKKKVCIFI